MFIFLSPKSKYAATINSQVKNFFFFFWNFLSNNNKNVDLKYQNLKEGEHFYFIQNQHNFASFFIENYSQKMIKTVPLVFSQATQLFCSSKFRQIVLKTIVGTKLKQMGNIKPLKMKKKVYLHPSKRNIQKSCALC